MQRRTHRRPSRRPRSIAHLLALTCLLATSLAAQAPTGNVYGTVTDDSGAPLPGVSVTVSGIGADRTQFTDDQGQFRFLSLDPGLYTLNAVLEGFGAVEYPNIEVRINRNTTVPLVLQSAVEETITVTSESPLLDERQLQAGTTVTQVELEKVPTARDPWAVLSQTPGVLVDRVNVGGSESGQQSSFIANGASDAENDFLVDGVQITDMSAIGASPSYYDFDQFAEMQFSTGGTDVTKNTSGVSVNLVTKRGSNQFRGSARFYNTKAGGYFGGALEQANVDVAGDLAPGQEDFAGAQIREVEDVGFEAGGSFIRDRLWGWGSWGQNDIQQNAASGTADDTILENSSIKLNAQITNDNSAVASWNNGDKQKFGRGAGVTRPDETTWNQRGPTAIYRFEDTHVFSSSLFLTGTYSIVDGGFQLAAKGGVGAGAPESFQDADGVWRDNYQSGSSSRPGQEFKADGSYFLTAGSTNHELKVGGRFRTFEAESAFNWPGRDLYTDATFLASGNQPQVVLHRGLESPPITQEYFSLWAQDTISMGRWTFNAGLRFDQQEGTNDPVTVAANPAFPELMPAIDFPRIGTVFDWTTIHPRLGVTYALGNDRDTLVRFSLAQFTDQLESDDITRVNPTGHSYLYYEFQNTDPSGKYVDEPLGALVDQNGIDPNNPAALFSPNVTDPGLDPPETTELIAGIEHALLPEFVIGLNLTWRNISDILDERAFIVTPDGAIRTETAADYVRDGALTGTLPNGQTYEVPLFALRDDFSRNGGRLLVNGDREREYVGGTLNFTKRLANQWMLRGYLNYGEAEWDVPASYTFNSDPNLEGWIVNDLDRATRDDVDGALFVTRSTGSGKGERFLQSTWSANLNGLYQVAPARAWGFNVAGNVTAREGYPVPYFERPQLSDGITRRISVVDDLADFRTDDVITVDFRVEKEFNLSGPVNMTFGIDAFNVFNETTELARQRQLDVGTADYLLDNVSPRIYRLGVRLAWR